MYCHHTDRTVLDSDAVVTHPGVKNFLKKKLFPVFFFSAGGAISSQVQKKNPKSGKSCKFSQFTRRFLMNGHGF